MSKKEIKVNQAMTQQAIYFDPDNKNVSFPELMPIFHNKNLNFAQGNMFGQIPAIEGRAPGHVFFDMPKGIEYYEDGSIRINCLAVGAKDVKYFNKGPLYPSDEEVVTPMEKVGENLFSAVIEKPIPGHNFIRFFADGNDIINPLVSIENECEHPMNMFDMPGEEFEFTYLKDVPHGTVRMNNYFSTVTGANRVCYVYTPPSYDDFGDRDYPVVYIQHGAGQTEFSWLWAGRVNYIMDNLIAEGKAEEMILVINNGYARPADPTGKDAFAAFADMLVKDCVPYIDGRYHTIADRTGRAMCGLSMGGMHTHMTVFKYPELFSAFGSFSSGSPVKGFFSDNSQYFTSAEKFNSLFDLGYVSCGDKEGDMFLQGYTELLDLKSKGYNVTTETFDGWHEWNVWRKSAHAFLQLVFKKK
jgi:enterochelin esterase-like enzyme